MPRRHRNALIDRHKPYYVYKRANGSPTIFVRDLMGHCQSFVYMPVQNRYKKGAAIVSMSPLYGRVDFANRVRFTGAVRSQTMLELAYQNATRKIKTAWVDLPPGRAGSRRTGNQGMNPATFLLTGANRSATQYVGWFKGQHPNANEVDATTQWEWCHLLAHSLGGGDNATNIVAAVKGNNSEQLAIESALSMYRMEGVFQMKISAATFGVNNGKHLGNVIRYKIRCTRIPGDFCLYLDCLNAPRPSAIHFYGVVQRVAAWANAKLQTISEYNNPVTGLEKREIRVRLI